MVRRRDFLKALGAAGTAAGCGPVRRESRRTEDISSGQIVPGTMTCRKDTSGEDNVSLLGFGCMRIPVRDISDLREGEKYDQESFNAMVDFALSCGVNYFDTSPRYCEGKSEEIVGKALSRHDRKSYYIATKMSNMAPETFSREESIAMYHRSMEYLQTDYFDYYLVHNVGNHENFKQRFLDNGILDFLAAERQAGRIRHLGWSFHGEKEFFDWMLDCGTHWDVTQIQRNYIDWQHASGFNVNAEYLYGELDKRGIQAIVMEPLRGGALARGNQQIRALFKGKSPERSVASWAFRFAASLPNVLTVLSGMTFMEHVRDNILTFSPFTPLDEEEKATVQQAVEAFLSLSVEGTPCTGCKYCMPCPYGLDIPELFLHYNRCLTEQTLPPSPEDDGYRRARRAFLIGYDRAVPRLRQADHCTGCRDCIPKCPQRIDIPGEMLKIDKYVEKLRAEGGF